MFISVIGCGYLGAVHASAMAELGHQVVGLDVDPEKVAKLNDGVPTIHEAGLEELLQNNLAASRLHFTTDPQQLSGAQIHFIGVGTPQTRGKYAADLSYVNQAVDSILAAEPPSDAPGLIAGKSTVPVGTAEGIANRVKREGKNFVVAWNPEFLREGFAIEDTLRPNRIVYGLSDEPAEADFATKILDECYADLIQAGIPRLLMNYPTAELVKVAANSFLATKISFINAMSELCEATGGDVTDLANAIGLDDRIGSKFLRAGIGFGGGCLPKDIRAFMARAGELGVDQALTFLREVDSINLRQRRRAVSMAESVLGGSVIGKKIAVLGAAFKPDSDDLRDSPALDIATQLVSRGADVTITDPAAVGNLTKYRPDLHSVATVDEAVSGAQLVMVLTEWAEYKNLDPAKLASLPSELNVIDGRNVLDPKAWRDAGWNYLGMGRK